MPGKSADDNIDIKKKTNFNKSKAAKKTAPKPRTKPKAKKASPPKPRSKPARKVAPKPRKKPDSVKAKGFKRTTDNAGGPRKRQSTAKPRAGMKSKGPAPKSNKSRKGNRIDRVR